MKSSDYVYFLYSDEQSKEKNSILAKIGKSFEAGTVVVNGTRKKYTQLSTSSTIPRFMDVKIVAEGILSKFTYTEPKDIRRGN